MKKQIFLKLKKILVIFLLKILFKIYFLTDILWFLSKIIFISQENGRIELSLQPFIVTVKGSEKNDPNLRIGILGRSGTPFIL